MTKGKNQNSILVLATLGVYLGLALAGAAPGVLAQAAMARQFDLKDEVEHRDGLDIKPPETFSDSVQVYLDDVEYFLSGLRRLHAEGKFDIENGKFEVAQSTLLPCTMSNKAGSYTAEKFSTSNQLLRPGLERFSKLLTDGYSLQDCLPTDRFPGVEATSSRFETRFDGKEFFVEVAVRKSSPDRALRLAGILRETLGSCRKPSNSLIRASLIDNTSARTRNDQVFVVTRLPRAGLTLLLASNKL